MTRAKADRKPNQEVCTAEFIARIQKRRETEPNMVAPWKRTWNAKNGAPRNMVSGKAYRGSNIFMTMLAGYGSPLWATYKQITTLGGQAREGEKGTPIFFWHFPQENKETGKKEGGIFVRRYSVFNTEQADGIEDRVAALLKPAEDSKPIDTIAEAEELLRLFISKPEIRYGGNRACYSPVMDYINCPNRDDFDSAEEYYRTLLHELAHSTGHKKRLARSGIMNPIRFGSHDYSEEELVAEMTAAMLASQLGIASPEADANSAAYLDHWLAKLAKNPEWLFHAGGQAQKASDFIQGITWK